jgi:anti-anti-sigma factor
VYSPAVPPSASDRRRLTWSLQVDRDPRDQPDVLRLSGRLGAPTVGDLNRVMDEVVRSGHRQVVLDCSGVDYVSSAGIAGLERAADRMRTVGGGLILRGLHDAVRVSLEVSGARGRLDWSDAPP